MTASPTGMSCWTCSRNTTRRWSCAATATPITTSSSKAFPASWAAPTCASTPRAGGFNLVEIKDGKLTVSERVIGQQTKPPWHSVVLEKHDYASDTNQYPRPDFSVNSRYPKVRTLWTYDTGYTIASTPAVWKDLAIVGDASGKVYALAPQIGQGRSGPSRPRTPCIRRPT